MTDLPAKAVLDVKDLQLELLSGSQYSKILKGISFSLEKGQILGILGESGSGKSMTMNAITGLLPRKSARISGTICLESDKNILDMPPRLRQQYCSSKISIILQDSINALSPYDRIGVQMQEMIRLHHPKLSKEEIQQLIYTLLEQIGIQPSKSLLCNYPHQFSGGMRQRIAIAMALASSCSILIADEPTTSLDAINQLKFVQLLKEIQQQRELSLIYISHNLGLLAAICDHVLVMKDGVIVERGSTNQVLTNPSHPYTKELVTSTKKLYC